VRQLADTITPQYRTLVLTAAYTGLRAGELAAFRVRDLDPLRRRIHVRESVADVGGKLHYGTPKNGKNREVAMPSFLADAIGEQVAGKDRDDLVFTGPNGAPLRQGNYYQRHYRPAVRQLVADGVWPQELEGLRFHDLRHTCAALMIKQGVHLKAMSARLGHSSISITGDTYGHLFDEHEDEIADHLDEAFHAASAFADTCSVTTIFLR
jgi:integrase